MKQILYSLSFVFLSLGFAASAQKQQLKDANEKFRELAYIDAQRIYLELTNTGYESSELFAKLGDTYYFNNDYKRANAWYAKLFTDVLKEHISSSYYFRYAQTLKSIGAYDQAAAVMKDYDAFKASDAPSSLYVTQPDYLELIEMNSGRFEIVNDAINTQNQDFGASYYRGTGKVVFASSKDTASLVRRTHKWNGRVFLDLFVADANPETGALSNAKKLEGINTKFHESNAVFSKDGNTVYFTRNNYVNREYKKGDDGLNKLKIFRATKNRDKGNWSNIAELSINSDDFSTAHPALNPAENRLYFASDRPGSIEGVSGDRVSDIWFVDLLNDGALGEPVNLKAINTAGNELFPFICANGDLYYSSNGQLGLGGLDIFKVTMGADQMPSKPINVGKPVNGQFDDFAFVMDDSSKLGYFSSNRPEGKGLDDIYRFKELLPLDCTILLKGLVINETTKKPLSGAIVAIVNENGEVIEEILTGDDARYEASLDCNTTYAIRGDKEEYATVEEMLETPVDTSIVEVTLALKRSTNDRLKDVKVGDNLKDVLELNPIYFDFDRSNIRYDAALELQKILIFMRASPSSAIEICSHTDSRAPDLYNMALSDRRAKSTRAYLIKKGISPSRLTAKGYGELHLTNVCLNGVPCTEEQHQLNRRSEFIVAKM